MPAIEIRRPEAGAVATIAAPVESAGASEEGEPPIFDESAEAAFLAEARERGEKVPVRAAEAVEEVSDGKALPQLDELVKRIPAEVREALDDLFRARFVTVRRVPAKALKE